MAFLWLYHQLDNSQVYWLLIVYGNGRKCAFNATTSVLQGERPANRAAQAPRSSRPPFLRAQHANWFTAKAPTLARQHRQSATAGGWRRIQ